MTTPLDGLADTIARHLETSMDNATPTPRALPTGVLPQIYLGAIKGADHAARIAALSAGLDAIRDAGCPGVLFHGFTDSIPQHWQEYASLAAARGLLALAAFGLPGEHTPAEAGRIIGTIAARPDCAGVFLDAEGAYDHGKAADATALVTALRQVAPTALVCDQPWFAPGSHSGFPFAEFARGCDVRCAQVYVNDFKSHANRCAFVFGWYERDWTRLETQTLARDGLVRPRVPTIQAEGWSDIPGDLAGVLATHPTLVAWCDHGLPPASFLAAVKARQTP